MLDFFPFVTKYYYKINIEQEECIHRLNNSLTYLPNYEGYISDCGLQFKRKRSIFYRNGFSTTVEGSFFRKESKLFFTMTFSVDGFVKGFSIAYALVACIASLNGILQKNYELAFFPLYFICILIFGKIFTYLFEEKRLIETIESALGVPERINKNTIEIN
jgi:hypothetical protein